MTNPERRRCRGLVRWVLLAWVLVWMVPGMAWSAEVERAEVEPVNAVLGDRSWVARYGEPPGDDASEVERIQVHLAYVEVQLRLADVSRLTQSQRDQRAWALDALASYREAGVFPRRTDDVYAGRRPRFIDDRGVHCAVGEMIRATGHAELAAAIDRDFEYAYIEEIDTEGLAEWAHAFGFSTVELAMIQPGYAPVPTREGTKQALESSIEADTLRCAVQHEPVRRFRLRVRGDRKGRAHLFAFRRAPFVRCFLGTERVMEFGGPYDGSPSPYRFGMTIRPEPAQQILQRRVDALYLDAAATSCSPRPGAIPETVDVHVKVDAQGRAVTVRTAPNNPEVDRCLVDYIGGRLAVFTAGRWSLEVRSSRPFDPLVSVEPLQREIEVRAPQAATDCYETDPPERAKVRARAVVDAESFEISVEGGGPEFVTCVHDALTQQLRSRFSVSRQRPDGTHEKYFRLDAEAEASHEFEVETPEQRRVREQQQKDELEREMMINNYDY